MLDIEDVIEMPFGVIPVTRCKRLRCSLEQRLPFRRERLTNPKSVDPESLYLHRLANTRRNNVAVYFCVHPSQLETGLARGEQAIRIRLYLKPRSLRVAGKDSFNRLAELSRNFCICQSRFAGGGLKVFMDGNHIPERCIDRVKFRLDPLVRETIR